MSSKKRIIMHVDLDYYYAQVEERDNPSIKDKPVVVCVYSGRSKNSGAVATANYIARKYGVKAGIPIIQAQQKLKDVDSVFLPMRKQYYTEISNQIMELLRSFADSFEQRSIDEAYLDVTNKVDNSFDKAYRYAKTIQRAVYKQFKLTCSIGIGPNKLVAKIASDFKKPNGITLVRPEEVQKFLAPLKVKDIPGIGPKTAQILNKMGYKQIGDLLKVDPTILTERFGKKLGSFIYNAARGIDNRPVKEKEGKKQIGKVHTLKEDIETPTELTEVLTQLVTEVNERILKNNISFRTINVTFVTDTLKVHSKSKTLSSYFTEINQRVTEEIRTLIDLFFKENEGVKVRRFGIRVSGLKREEKTKQGKLTDFF
ncbi:MAG: DNA polymerase IV [Candidatus Odinarchaeota archaeon]|nr:DNA polymerase IV [Candidatus Odinarchaeota archaeon]